MQTVRFKQVDVFSNERYKGNPVAVVLEAHGLSSEQMQAVANWTNLSETTFVLPPSESSADYQVRIFTPQGELPFAGHPTLGTAHALLESGMIALPQDGRIIQQCKAGLITLDVKVDNTEQYHIAFSLPKEKITALSSGQSKQLAGLMNCQCDNQHPATIIDTGPQWVVMQAKNADAVLNCQPDLAQLKRHSSALHITGVTIFGRYPEGSIHDIEVRSFAPICGIDEDPVCGSGNGSVAAYIRHYQLAFKNPAAIRSSQGQMLQRKGRMELLFTENNIWIRGTSHTCIEGMINI